MQFAMYSALTVAKLLLFLAAKLEALSQFTHRMVSTSGYSKWAPMRVGATVIHLPRSDKQEQPMATFETQDIPGDPGNANHKGGE